MTCARNGRTNKKQRKLRLLSPADSLGSVVIDILSALPKTEDAYKYIVGMMNRYYKLSKAKLTARTTTKRISNICKNIG